MVKYVDEIPSNLIEKKLAAYDSMHHHNFFYKVCVYSAVVPLIIAAITIFNPGMSSIVAGLACACYAYLAVKMKNKRDYYIKTYGLDIRK